jgi:hypothetical protein
LGPARVVTAVDVWFDVTIVPPVPAGDGKEKNSSSIMNITPHSLVPEGYVFLLH